MHYKGVSLAYFMYPRFGPLENLEGTDDLKERLD
jgi:hypothetical protein